MRKLYWYVTSFAKKHGLVILATVVGAILLFSVLLPIVLEKLSAKTTRYIGIIGQHSLERLPESIQKQLSVGLTQVNSDDTVSPVLADRWTAEQDGTSYRFVLKEGLVWKDGAPFTTEQIQLYLPNVETIITPRDIVFKLPAPYAPFPSAVSQPLFKEGEIRNYLFFRKPTLIGIGTNYEISDYITKSGSSNLVELHVQGSDERFVYRFYLTESDAVTAFQKGEVDEVRDLAKVWPLMQWSTVATTATIHPDQYSAVFFNHQNPLFTKNLRQALAYAIKKPNPELSVSSPVSSLSWAYYPASKVYDQDIERGIDRILEDLPREPIVFELTTTTLFENLAVQLVSDWEAFGKQAKEKCQASSQIQEKSLCDNLEMSITLRIANFPDTTNFDLMLIGQKSPSDPDQYELWHSNQPTNFSAYKNTRIDTILEKGRQVSERSERLQLYQDFQQFLTEDVAAIFLERLITYRIERI